MKSKKAVPGSLGCIFGIALLVRGFWHTSPASKCQLHFELDSDAGFRLKMADQTWLESAALRFFLEGAWHSSSGQNATVKQVSKQQYVASDRLGRFSCVNVTWSVVGPGVLIHTSFKTYLDSCAIIFTQEIPHGAQGTNASKAELPKDGHKVEQGAFPPIFSFPSFVLSEQLQNLGFLTWKGTFAQAIYGKNVTEHLAGLSSNGPVVLFDLTSSLIVSPLDNFKTAVHTCSFEANAWETGVSSELTSIPRGFSHRTLIIAGVGVTQAIDAYGKTVRKIYSTDRSQEKFDPVINYLSYWTAAGLPNLTGLTDVDSLPNALQRAWENDPLITSLTKMIVGSHRFAADFACSL